MNRYKIVLLLAREASIYVYISIVEISIVLSNRNGKCRTMTTRTRQCMRKAAYIARNFL